MTPLTVNVLQLLFMWSQFLHWLCAFGLHKHLKGSSDAAAAAFAATEQVPRLATANTFTDMLLVGKTAAAHVTFVTLDHKTCRKSHGYICSNSQQSEVESNKLHFPALL